MYARIFWCIDRHQDLKVWTILNPCPRWRQTKARTQQTRLAFSEMPDASASCSHLQTPELKWWSWAILSSNPWFLIHSCEVQIGTVKPSHLHRLSSDVGQVSRRMAFVLKDVITSWVWVTIVKPATRIVFHVTNISTTCFVLWLHWVSSFYQSSALIIGILAYKHLSSSSLRGSLTRWQASHVNQMAA